MAQKKRAMWTDMVGVLTTRESGPTWLVKATHLREWSIELHRKDISNPYDLFITEKVNEDWIQMPHAIIKGASQETKSSIIELKVLEGVETRTLVLDTNKHVFNKEPFEKSIQGLNEDDRISLMAFLRNGISKRAIVCILGVAEDLTETENREREKVNASKKKQAVDIMSKKSSGEGSSRPSSREAPRPSQSRRSQGERSSGGPPVVAHNVLPLQSFPAMSQQTSGSNPRRVRSQDRQREDENSEQRTGNTSMDVDTLAHEEEQEQMSEDEDLDIARPVKRKTQDEGTSRGRKRAPKKSKKEPKDEELIPRSEKVATTVKPGETLDLTEAAKDKEVFVRAYGPIYVLGLDFIVRIPLQQLRRGQSHQVTNTP